MRVLLLGGTGMLGHRLWINLQKEHEVWVTVRGGGNPFPDVPQFPADRIVHRVDGLTSDDVIAALGAVRPELVINCIGLIKQLEHAGDPLPALSMNALLPHRVAAICRAVGARFIHISTDCVFSGRKGNYAESDPSDAEDVYGRTKFLGEVQGPHALTLRTSIIGQELKNRLGLVEWFLAQTGTIRGYRKAMYSGFTTHELSRILLKHVIPDPGLSGLYQVSSEPISKYDLLLLAKEAYGSGIEIVAEDRFVCDRTLDSTRFRKATGYGAPSWAVMIREMASDAAFYDRLRLASPGAGGADG
jgi:dTDP-4-dehydrorhamnose reductase